MASVWKLVGKTTLYNGDETIMTAYFELLDSKTDEKVGREMEKLFREIYSKYYFTASLLTVGNQRRSPTCNLYPIEISERSSWKVLAYQYIWADSQKEADEIANKCFQRLDLDNQHLYKISALKTPVKIANIALKDIAKLGKTKIDFAKNQDLELKKLKQQDDELRAKMEPLENQMRELQERLSNVRSQMNKISDLAENKIDQEFAPQFFETTVSKYQESHCGNCGQSEAYGRSHSTDVGGGMGTSYSCASRYSSRSGSGSYDYSNRFGF